MQVWGDAGVGCRCGAWDAGVGLAMQVWGMGRCRCGAWGLRDEMHSNEMLIGCTAANKAVQKCRTDQAFQILALHLTIYPIV